MKEFFRKHFMDENGNPSIIAKIICLGIFLIIILSFVLFGRNKNDEVKIAENAQIEAEDVDKIEEVIEETELKEKAFQSILNVNKIDMAKVDSQIKFLTTNNDSYSDLMSLSYVGNMQNVKNELNLRGFFTLKIASFDISLEAPIFANNIKNNDFSIYIDVPSAYKPSFNMSQEQSYLFINKENIDIINEKYKLFDKKQKEESSNSDLNDIKKEFEKFDSIVTYEAIDETSGVYSFELNEEDIKGSYQRLEENKKDNFLINLITFVFNGEENISNFYKVKGQIAASQEVATDIYIEIEDYLGNITAIRFVFENINDGSIFVNKFEDENIKSLSDFFDNLNLLNNQSSSDQSENVIEIKEIFFTGEDETIKQEIFTIDNVSSCINVFINFTNCTKQTNLVIKWFYEDQDIPIIETKISNGDYDEGMLKSSISFTDKENIQLGKYTLKIFIEGQEEAICEQFFEILEKEPVEEEVSEDIEQNEATTSEEDEKVVEKETKKDKKDN